MLSQNLKEELEFIVTVDVPLLEMPQAMECGRTCNGMLPAHGGREMTSRKGSLVGALVGGPFGMMYGGQMPLNSLHQLCRARCKLSKMQAAKAPSHEISIQKQKVKEKQQTVMNRAEKVRNPEVMKTLARKIMSYKF